MSTTAQINPVAEMGRYITGSINMARGKRLFAELLGWEAAKDIHAEEVDYVNAIADKAYKAEVYIGEGLKLLAAAQSPDSEGGTAITENEARKFIPLLNGAQDAAHDAGEMAAI